MDELSIRLRQNATLDEQVAVAAESLHRAAASVSARPASQPSSGLPRSNYALDFGDGSMTPPRSGAGSRTRDVPPSPVSPAVRAVASASAVRRGRLSGAPNGADVATTERSRPKDAFPPSVVGVVDSDVGTAVPSSGIPRFRSAGQKPASGE